MYNKYLMFDIGGVLDGSVIETGSINPKMDLVLCDYKEGFSQVLSWGKDIIEQINELVEGHGFKVVLHSTHPLNDQIKTIEQLIQGSAKLGVKFPAVHALGVFDEHCKKEATDPELIETVLSNGQKVSVAQWGGVNLKGKASLRRALEKVLGINEDDRPNHIVFDDGEPIITQAQKEGYRTYLIGCSIGSALLDDAIAELHSEFCKSNNFSM